MASVMRFDEWQDSNGVPVASSTDLTWASWTPTFTNFTLGNGTVDAKYVQIGSLVSLRLEILLGSTSSITGAVTFSPPVAISADEKPLQGFGIARYRDVGTAAYAGTCDVDSGNFRFLVFNKAANDYTVTGGLSSTIPHTWAATDALYANLTYRSA